MLWEIAESLPLLAYAVIEGLLAVSVVTVAIMVARVLSQRSPDVERRSSEWPR